MIGIILILEFSFTSEYKICWHTVWKAKRYRNLNSDVLKNKNGRLMLLSNWAECTVCGSKKSRFMNEQEAKGSLSSLDLKTPLSKFPLLGNILFWMQSFHWIVVASIK